MSHARMSRNASTTRALLRSKSRLPSDLLTTQIPLSASYSGLSSPLQSQSPLTTTITNVNSSKNNASSCYRRPSSVVPSRVTLFVVASALLLGGSGVSPVWSTYILIFCPRSPTLHASLLPPWLFPSPSPPPPTLVNLYCSLLHLLYTLPEFISSLSGRWPPLPDLQLLPTAVHLL